MCPENSVHLSFNAVIRQGDKASQALPEGLFGFQTTYALQPSEPPILPAAKISRACGAQKTLYNYLTYPPSSSSTLPTSSRLDSSP